MFGLSLLQVLAPQVGGFVIPETVSMKAGIVPITYGDGWVKNYILCKGYSTGIRILFWRHDVFCIQNILYVVTPGSDINVQVTVTCFKNSIELEIYHKVNSWVA